MYTIAPIHHGNYQVDLKISEYPYNRGTGSLLVISSSDTAPNLVIEISDDGELIAHLSGADGPYLLMNVLAQD